MRPAAVGMVIAGALLVVAGAWAGPQDAAEQARVILRGARYQTELPLDGVPPTEGGLAKSRERSGPRTVPLWLPLPSPTFVALVVVALLVAIGLAALLRQVHGGPALAAGAAAPARPGGRGARPAPRADAEALALAGRFAEAIHALLLNALRELGRSTTAPALSQTSREVLRHPVLVPEARAALGPLVSSV
ncbi:MAG TPA: hypothetical protein VF310_03385, partial [Vicinamibacteria bacterium]